MWCFRLKLVLLLLLLVAVVNCFEGDPPSLHDSGHIHNAEHIREHMKDYMNDAGELNLDDEDAMEFHYFKLHDYDNNDKLDGLELAAAMTHYHEEGEGGNSANEKIHSIDIADEEIGNLVDSILRDDDLNNDGYIDYYEFVAAQNRNKGEGEGQV